jgi:pyridoxamine 5'-phosphate oxidase
MKGANYFRHGDVIMTSDEVFRDVRKEYQQGTLDEGALLKCPFQQFTRWFDAALQSGQVEPNACALGTVGEDGQPSVRMILLKSYDTNGFVFYTNYLSRKGRHLSANPLASLLFYWPAMERQIRIEGRCEKVSEAESDRYFYARPKGAQLGAAVSQQSASVESRIVLEEAYQKLAQAVGEGRVERPSTWGGYRIVPHEFEFWQGRESRLHDRIRYARVKDQWGTSRLWP